MKKLSALLNEKVIPYGILFLIFFIPLYPKLPIIDIFGTWVYIRLEDFLVLVLASVYLISRWFERRLPQTQLTTPIFLYWLVGALSVINSILFIGPHLQNFLPHLALLHFMRRIEYMILFFIAYDVISRRRSYLKTIIWILAIVLIFITAYGIGQKFAGFPAFLTMNEEFAKGVPLRLPPTARIVSTFGGHYDLAAYLVLIIPIAGSLVIGLRNIWQKLLFLLVSVGGVVLLLFTASRISFGVYLIAVSTMLAWQKKKLFIVPVIAVSIVLLNFVSSASERFYKTFRYQDVIVDLSTGKPIGTLDKLEGTSAVLEEIEKPDEENLPKGSGFIGVAPGSGTDQSSVSKLIISKDIATGSGEVATLSGSFLIQKALVYDISITTRFQGQWPKAIAAFNRNIFFGSGFSTLSTAVDGNYHRLIGETGILGAFAFLGIIVFSFHLFFRGRKDLTSIERAFVTGFFAGLVGLLFNAVLIDVFEASKVAFSFWILMGVVMGLLPKDLLTQRYLPFLRKLLLGNFAIHMYVFWGAVFLYREALSGFFLGDDFTWMRWAAESTWTDISKVFTESTGFFYRPIPKLWYFILYSVFWLKTNPYHILSVLLYASICLLLYKIMRKLHIKQFIAMASALLYAGLAVHHENVFWISGQSSLLGSLFLALALYLTFTERLSKPPVKYVWAATVGILVFLSMLSYDSLLIAPIILFLVYVFIHKIRFLQASPILLLLPAYWGLRTASDALLPSGDYGYKPSTFVVNSIANTLTYIVATFAGPKAIESASALRLLVKPYLVPLTVAMGIVGSVAAVFFWTIRRKILQHTVQIALLLSFVVSLFPFIGLGGSAERYAIVPTFFIILSLASLVSEIKLSKARILVWGSLTLLYLAVFIWNITEVSRISTEWKFAGHVSEETLLKLKREYFPLTVRKTFIFVDTPIRYGRAWIFPTGLTDALWHMFRQAPFTVLRMSNIEDALLYPQTTSSVVVHRFENYIVKKVEVLVTETE